MLPILVTGASVATGTKTSDHSAGPGRLPLSLAPPIGQSHNACRWPPPPYSSALPAQTRWSASSLRPGCLTHSGRFSTVHFREFGESPVQKTFQRSCLFLQEAECGIWTSFGFQVQSVRAHNMLCEQCTFSFGEVHVASHIRPFSAAKPAPIIATSTATALPFSGILLASLLAKSSATQLHGHGTSTFSTTRAQRSSITLHLLRWMKLEQAQLSWRTM